MDKCTECGSHAINHGQNGRPPKQEQTEKEQGLCDVCFFKSRLKRLGRKLNRRERRLTGTIFRIRQLERALAQKTITSEKLQIDIKKEVIEAVQHALMNVRFIPVHNFLSTPEVVVSIEKKA
jgi:hypothetical protein